MDNWRDWDGEQWVFAFLAATIGPVVAVFCIGLFLFVFVWLPWDTYQNWGKPAETFALPKDAWHCGQSHSTTVTTYVMVGKVMTPITTNVEECIAWVKNS